MQRALWSVAACLMVAGACTESTAPTDAGPTAPLAVTAATASSTTVAGEVLPVDSVGVPNDGSVIGAYAGRTWFAGIAPASATAADTTLEPIVVGMINQENSPVGSFPEIRAAVEAAVAWINAELGGVNGRPIELRTCITSFSAEQSQACAQQMVQAGAVAVLSGIDITASGSLPVLEQNGIPMISVLPTTLAELRSTNDFSFSGGITGAYVAFVADAHDRGIDSVAIAYGDFESFNVPATEYGAKVAANLGMRVTLIPFGIGTTDYLPVVQAALDSGAGAITIGAADTACAPIVKALDDLGYTGQLYMVGACAAPQILAQMPDEAQARVIFNSEGPATSAAEAAMFFDVTEVYATEPAGGAGTVGFRAIMNLWAAMRAVDGDVSSSAIITVLRSSSGEPSFWGHPYTCDGKQVPGFPSLCSPQQTLFSIADDSGAAAPTVTDWIDVPMLVASLTPRT
jgi:branched-chain amino acid transport system substrate-binding protein